MSISINRLLSGFFVPVAVLFSGATGVLAQQVTGVPGSPSATTTIEGKQLPAPPAKFGGKIGRTANESTPYWSPRIVPPTGSPNVLLIITDDAGFGVPSTFGGVIPTPASVCPAPSVG